VAGVALSFVGGALVPDARPRSPGVEARIALGGLLAVLATAALAALVHVALVEAGADRLAATVPALLAAGNLGIAAFNVLPGLPLDGGRLLRAAVWWATGDAAAAARTARWAGRVLAGGLLVLAFIASTSGHPTAALWVALLSLAMVARVPAGVDPPSGRGWAGADL
jgi:Zn-dependent protease